MKASQFFGPRDIRVVDVPTPEPKENEALIAIEWCGICGSDIHEYLYGPLAVPTKERPNPITGDYLPVTMGHEFSGRIIRAPADSGLKPGQPVMIDPRIYCGNCPRCSAGHSHVCKTIGFKGLSGSGGGFSETVAVDAKMCHALPEDTDLSLAALIEPLAVAWHAVATCGVSNWPDRSTLIVGGGPVGIAHIFVLRVFGCKQIFVSQSSAARAAQNRSFADVVFNPEIEAVGERCRELTGGEGVDIVFDCAGNQAGLDVGMDSLGFKGTFATVSSWIGTPMTIPFMDFLLKEITVKAFLAYTDEDFRDTVEAFVAGRFNGIETMISSRIHIDNISEKGFDELVTNKNEHIKILVTPDKSKIESA